MFLQVIRLFSVQSYQNQYFGLLKLNHILIFSLGAVKCYFLKALFYTICHFSFWSLFGGFSYYTLIKDPISRVEMVFISLIYPHLIMVDYE